MSVLRTSIKAYTLHPIFIVIESWRGNARLSIIVDGASAYVFINLDFGCHSTRDDVWSDIILFPLQRTSMCKPTGQRLSLRYDERSK